MYFFTADEHYGHKNVCKYCNRPFKSVEEMNEALISNHNKIVTRHDTTIHAGDFSFGNKEDTAKIIKRLNGNNFFLRGDHDYWLRESAPHIKQFKINKTKIIVCHYPLASWHASNYGSLQLHGHSHGKMLPVINRLDVGVDANNYTPVSEVEVFKKIEIQNAMLNTLAGQCCFNENEIIEECITPFSESDYYGDIKL